MVIPSAMATAATAAVVQPTDETQVLGARGSAPRPPTAADGNTVALTHSAQKRRRRGWWLAAIIAVLVVAASGTGWYFGAGPGSLVKIPPSIVGMSVADATTTITRLGLKVNPTRGSVDSPTVPVGSVAAATPAVGASIARGATIQLLVSTGPKPIAVPAFAGMTEEEAKAAIAAAPFTLAATIRQFDAKTPKGLVIDVLGADGASILTAATYGDRQPVSLIVSAGGLPDVACKSVDEATKILAGVKLTAQSGKQEFNDCAAGSVAGIDPQPDANGNARVFREGDTVSLIISRGPDLVQVPNVVGDNIAAAKTQLEALGFVVTVDSLIPENSWDNNLAVVESTTPDASMLVKRGSTVTIKGKI
jgi:serine/threonine-protein kinase